MKNKPDIHHSDQGVHYAAYAYIDLLKVHDIRISMAAVGKAEENGYAERVIRTIKKEQVDLSEYFSFTDANYGQSILTLGWIFATNISVNRIVF